MSKDVKLFSSGDLIYVERDNHGVIVYYVHPDGRLIVVAAPQEDRST